MVLPTGVYSQNRREHIAMILSDAVCELFAARDDIPAQLAVLMFFLCVSVGPCDRRALACLLRRLLDLSYLLTLLRSFASL